MRFDTDFPGGNGRLLRAEEKEYGWEIEFLAECKAREPLPLWFYFKLYDLTGTKVRLKLANSSQCLGSQLGWSTNHPVYREDGGAWKRVETVENGFTGRHILETRFEVPLTGDTLEFAFFYPYQLAQMEKTARACSGAFDTEIIGYSTMGRPMYRYVNTERYFDPQNPDVYITGRQHAGEATGSYEIDGMMRYLASAEGEWALRKINWWFVPMVDIDGVEEGYYGKNQVYNDLNRSWSMGVAKRTELVCIQRQMKYLKKNGHFRFYLDMHAPAHEERDTYFVVSADWPQDKKDELRRIFERVAAETEKLGYQPPYFNEQPAGTNTGSQTGWCGDDFTLALGVNGCAFECTYQGERNGRNYTEDDYRAFGKCIVKALAGYLEP